MGKHLTHDSHIAKRNNINPMAIRYSLAKKLSIHADISAGMTEREVALRHGCSPATVHYIKTNEELNEIQNPIIVDTRRKAMANVYYWVADRLLDGITDESLNKLTPFQRIVASGICVDKARLVEGLSTENLSLSASFNSFQSELEQIKKKRLELSNLTENSVETELVSAKK